MQPSALGAQLREAKQAEKYLVGQNNHAAALQRVTELKEKYRQASNNVATAQNSVRKATESLNKPLLSMGQLAGSAGKSLLAAFGGPAGIAITALGGGIAYLASQESLAEKAARNHADALKVVTSGANDATGAMSEYLKIIQEKSRFELNVDIQKSEESIKKFKEDFLSQLQSIEIELNSYYERGYDAPRELLLEYEAFNDVIKQGFSTTSLDDFKLALQRIAQEQGNLIETQKYISETVNPFRGGSA